MTAQHDTHQFTQSYLTVQQFCEQHRAFRPGGLRAWIFNENQNGLAQSGAVVRIGRKVLINQERFFDWVRSNGAKAAI